MRDNKAITSAQVVLEEVLETALEGITDAQARNEHTAVAAFYHVLSVAKTNAEALEVKFVNDELNRVDPDALLKGERSAT